MNTAEQSNKMNQIIAKCWADEAFKKQLIADPVAMLKAEGVELPEGISVTVVEDTATSITVVIPLPRNLSDDELAGVAGGYFVQNSYTIPM